MPRERLSSAIPFKKFRDFGPRFQRRVSILNSLAMREFPPLEMEKTSIKFSVTLGGLLRANGIVVCRFDILLKFKLNRRNATIKLMGVYWIDLATGAKCPFAAYDFTLAAAHAPAK
jgi:hypothetical protein